jgi:hypothetical protein
VDSRLKTCAEVCAQGRGTIYSHGGVDGWPDEGLLLHFITLEMVYSGDVVEATSREYAQDVISGLCRGELAYMVIGAQGPVFSLLRFVLV